MIQNEIEESEFSDPELPRYSCTSTSIERNCDYLDGDDTACHIEEYRVQDHQLTRYTPGWIDRTHTIGALPETGVVRNIMSFVGLATDEKEVPDDFSVRSYSPEIFTIKPGETKYFELEIGFPIHSTGEYWIEAVGSRTYGLLDPFWNSSWQYRMPVSVENTSSSEVTETQVFLEFDSSLTDFWTNVASDGSDIRFVQEFTDNSNADNWYATPWKQRLPLTIQSSQVDSTLTDFPVYVDLSTLGAGFFAAVKTDGSDIRITTDDGQSELPYELVSIDTGAQTGELYFKAPTLNSSSDTTFYIYFENLNATAYLASDPYGSENVWDSDYEAVYHLGESSSGSSGEFNDSTANDNDGRGEDTLPTQGTGKIGTAQSFAESGKIDIGTGPNAGIASNSAYTLSAWINQNSSSNDQSIVSQYTGGGDILFWADTADGGQGFCHYNGSYMPNDCRDQSDQNPGTWQHLVAGYGSGEGYIYVDGALTGSGRTATTFGIDGALPWAIGAANGNVSGGQSGTTRWFNGLIDEVRISSVDRSEDWTQAEFRNIDDPESFYATRQKILTGSTFVELDYWIQHFDNTTDTADVWVQVESLPATASTTIYMYYGNASASSASDLDATFTYNSLTDLYYVNNNVATADVVVYSLIDNNQVQLDGGAVVDLDKGESTTFGTFNGDSVIKALGPLSSVITDNTAETLVPIGFASTTHVVPTSRDNEQFYLFSPYATSTYITYLGAAAS